MTAHLVVGTRTQTRSDLQLLDSSTDSASHAMCGLEVLSAQCHRAIFIQAAALLVATEAINTLTDSSWLVITCNVIISMYSTT